MFGRGREFDFAAVFATAVDWLLELSLVLNPPFIVPYLTVLIAKCFVW